MPKAARKVTRKHTPARKPRYTARTADKYELYQLAVQSPANDLSFLRRVYKKLRGKEPLHLREDFCGTALLSATWVKGGKDRTAEGFDLDPEPLAWGKKHNITPLGDAASRVTLHEADVREKGNRAYDLRLAQNFSYCILKTRVELLDYFRRVRKELAQDGILVLDLYGGTEATDAIEEERKIDEGFTYVWDQYRFLPGSGDYTCYIHFRFKDGTSLERAFSYQWRFWTMPELKELLLEAGFSEVQSWFEQTDDDAGEGNGVYKRDETGVSCQDCAGWIAYILALK